MVDWGVGSVYHDDMYMCILLYMQLLWCSGVTYIYCQLEEGGWGLCALVSVHSSICETYAVQWSSIDLWSLGGGGWGLSALVSVHTSICET